ncbi:MAG TPA: glycosyltransferase family 9 protein [Fluviicola sp.]|nr:glycosyltransferase family 9 protein [Fluviicola sp.]
MKTPVDCTEKRIVISRTDSIGDVMLTLPTVAWLKETYPSCHITFLCRNYTKAIVSCYEGIDEVLTLETLEALPSQSRVRYIREQQFDVVVHVFPRKELAQLFKKAAVPARIGTSHRGFHLLTCNIRPNFSRKRSSEHEAQLNFELLRPLGVTALPKFDQLNAWTNRFHVPEVALPEEIEEALQQSVKAAVLHPKSQGSAREWPMEKYVELANRLTADQTTVFFTGTEQEGALFRAQLPDNSMIIDTTGKLSIEQLLVLLSRIDLLVACSTGPLHIAGFLGKRAIGLFSPRIPIHPGRWRALGEKAVALVFDPDCPTCKAKKPCSCIEQITVEKVLENR